MTNESEVPYSRGVWIFVGYFAIRLIVEAAGAIVPERIYEPPKDEALLIAAYVGLLGEGLAANGARADYLRAEHRDGRVFASRIQDSAMLRTLARATCLIVRAPHAPAAQVGDSVEILDLA